jgi:hypothetical protein
MSLSDHDESLGLGSCSDCWNGFKALKISILGQKLSYIIPEPFPLGPVTTGIVWDRVELRKVFRLWVLAFPHLGSLSGDGGSCTAP